MEASDKGRQENVCKCPALEIQGTASARGKRYLAAVRRFPVSGALQEGLGARGQDCALSTPPALCQMFEVLGTWWQTQ